MSGLIFLWQNIVPSPSVNTDYGLKPQILIDDETPTLIVDPTDAVFSESTTLVNDTIITVNSSDSTVGGSDSFSWLSPDISFMDFMKPILTVGASEAEFSDETALVNDTVFLVNDPLKTVGGNDLFSSKPDISARIDDVKPLLFRVGNL